VVYEIACSQDGRELGKVAWTYIPYSKGNIKAVVGFDFKTTSIEGEKH
jgi:hypothetical protein